MYVTFEAFASPSQFERYTETGFVTTGYVNVYKKKLLYKVVKHGTNANLNTNTKYVNALSLQECEWATR